MNSFLSIDFETRSTVNLKKTGVYAYAEHPDTNLWCAAYAFDDEGPEIWVPGDPPPERIVEHVKAGGEIRAWNANFERVIWWLILTPTYGWPMPKLEQFWCTAADAAAMALPRALAHAAQVLNVEVQKDMEGRKLLLKMTKPRSTKSGEIVWFNRLFKETGDLRKPDSAQDATESLLTKLPL